MDMLPSNNISKQVNTSGTRFKYEVQYLWHQFHATSYIIVHLTLQTYHRCHCVLGTIGKNCELKDFCQTSACPGNSICSNLGDGYEC